MDINGQLSIWDVLSEGTEEVNVEGAINVRPPKGERIGPFKVTLTTGDLQLIVAMIEDYIRGLDVIKEGDIQWEAYYRKKFQSISSRIQEQINYDYEKQLEKCLKKQKEDDIGEEALALMIKRSKKEAEKNEQRENNQGDH